MGLLIVPHRLCNRLISVKINRAVGLTLAICIGLLLITCFIYRQRFKNLRNPPQTFFDRVIAPSEFESTLKQQNEPMLYNSENHLVPLSEVKFPGNIHDKNPPREILQRQHIELLNEQQQQIDSPETKTLFSPPKFARPSVVEIRGPAGAPTDESLLMKREILKDMMRYAWGNYFKYAWGHNELRPVSKTFHNIEVLGVVPLGATIIDAIDTLYIMGLEEEYRAGADWIRTNLTFADAPTEVSVFEVTIRYIGGLLSIFSMTQDLVFLSKAREIADSLLPAFTGPSGLPTSLLNLKTKMRRNFRWTSGGSCHVLSEVGTLHMEFQYLSELTNDDKYSKIVHKIRNYLESAYKSTGIFATNVDPKTPKFCNERVTVSGEGDSFFEYLLKEWIRTGQQDTQAKELYDASLKMIDRLGMIKESPAGSLYIIDNPKPSTEHMDHLACFSGGMFALGAVKKDASDIWFERGRRLTETCRKSYAQTDTHLGPERMVFASRDIDAVGLTAQDKRYLLRPETIESYFYMWRFTHNPIYRAYAWDVVQGLQNHCKTDGGYSGIIDVYGTRVVLDNVQQSYFLAETLKYLYLIFSDDSVLPLDRWVFNTEAHPFPIKQAMSDHSN